MIELHYLPSFERDLDDIWLYVAEENETAADRLVSKLYDRCLILCDFPEAGPRRDELPSEVRQLVEGNYVILYRIRNNRLELIRALHAKRRIGPDVL